MVYVSTMVHCLQAALRTLPRGRAAKLRILINRSKRAFVISTLAFRATVQAWAMVQLAVLYAYEKSKGNDSLVRVLLLCLGMSVWYDRSS